MYFVRNHVLSRVKYINKLIPWSRFLPEKLTGSQLVEKYLAFCGAQRFITAFTSACQVSPSIASDPVHASPFPLVKDPF
jgi:hypothetical protein